MWDLRKYKTPNHFDGMIMKGYVAASVHRELEKDYINLIKIYRNDIYNFSFDMETSVDKTEMPENVIAFSSTMPLNKYSDVWVAVSYGGISGLIILSGTTPILISSDNKEDKRYIGSYVNPEHAVKYLKQITFVDFKTVKFKRISLREKESLLNKMKMVINKTNLKDLENTDNIDFEKVFESLDRKGYILVPSNWNGETSSIIPIDFILSLVSDPRTKIRIKDGSFSTIIINDQEVVIALLRPLNNKQAIDILMKGVKESDK